MVNNFYCTCDDDCEIGGCFYYKDKIYNIQVESYFGFYEVLDGKNFVGYLDPFELDCNFTTVMFIINDIDKMFNSIMDLWT